MKKITVQFASFISNITKEDERTFETDAKTVGDLLLELGNIYGEEFKKKIFIDGKRELRPFILCFINGVDIKHFRKLETRLMNGDSIVLLPAFAGG